MPECANCGKRVGYFDLKSYKDLLGNYYCSGDCKSKYKKKAKGKIKEIQCKCKQCGKIWHYLEKDKKTLEWQAASNSMISAGMCCSPFGGLFSNKSIDKSNEAKKLEKCPECNSSNITKKTQFYDKK